MSFESIIQST